MSDLEKFILENRDELDRMEAVPAEAIWQKLRAESGQPKPPAQRGPNWKLVSVAALVLALSGWGILLFKKAAPAPLPPKAVPPKMEVPIAKQPETPEMETPIAPPKSTERAAETAKLAAAPPKKGANIAKQPKAKRQPPNAPEPQPPAVSEEERRLQQMVAQKQREIGLDTLDRQTYASLLRELDELEISVEEARRDLGGVPQRERLMETLIRYYELKIRILEQINYEINKQQYHEALEKRI